jgi:citrate lyase subunit beta/citryl-CoA lyase
MKAANRSFLFVPGNRPDRFDKACATNAHAVIVDLEDAVPAVDKVGARVALGEWLSDARRVLVRVNAPDTQWFADVVQACSASGVSGVVVPKAERVEDLRRVAAACGYAPIFPLIESAQGLWNALAIARDPGVQSLLFGSLDFQADVGISDDDLLHARSHLVLVSRVAGIGAPVDGVTPAVDDPELLRRDCQRSRKLGFSGKLCIHPRQVDIVNDCFAPTSDEIQWAESIVDAFSRADGNAVLVDGRMVDRPVLLKANAILRERQSREPRS